jgi:hypothetical protein
LGRFAWGAESGDGVLAPNSPLRAGVTALVEAQAARKEQAGKAETEPNDAPATGGMPNFGQLALNKRSLNAGPGL